MPLKINCLVISFLEITQEEFEQNPDLRIGLKIMSYRMNRRAYADTYGATTGDRVRLADTELFIEVERDYTTYGDEVKFGGGKVIRAGPVPPPIIVVMPEAIAVSICWGQIK